MDKELKRLKKRIKKTERRELHKKNKEARREARKEYKYLIKVRGTLKDLKYPESIIKKNSKKIDKIYFKSIKKADNLIKNEPPHLTTLEEVGNSVTHGIGALLAIVALVLLLSRSNTTLKIVASCFYGISMFLEMAMSSLYHAFKAGSKVKRIWRRFDYSSIYLLIGGTFAPLLLVYMGNTLGIVWFIIQWTLIVTGITMVGIFGPGRLKWLHFPLYFVLGWSGLMLIPDFIKNNMQLFYFILAGGLVYTLGMIPFVKRGVPAAHFIWHFFVLAGAIVHFIGIFICLY